MIHVRYGAAPPGLPAVAGIEGVGSIAAVGSGVKGLKPNDRVIPTGPWFGITIHHTTAYRNNPFTHAHHHKSI